MASKPTPDPFNFIHDTDRLDQHFLDAPTAQHIVGAAPIASDNVILDIGAGTGILTAAILQMTHARVIAVEPDDRCVPHLERLQADHPNLTLMIDRIQNTPRAAIADTSLVVANPPFSALEHLARFLRELPRLRQAILCVGQGWANTATAKIGTVDYRTTSVALQSRFEAAVIGSIDGGAFTPPIRQPAVLLDLTQRRMTDPALDLFADAVLNRAGSRLKDFLRSRRLRQALGANHHRAMIHDRSLRQLQQSRLRDLTNGHISSIATLLTVGPPRTARPAGTPPPIPSSIRSCCTIKINSGPMPRT